MDRRAYADKSLVEQETLIATENDSTSRETVQQAFDFGLKVARGNLDRAMSAAGVDLLIGPGDSDLYTYAALAGKILALRLVV